MAVLAALLLVVVLARACGWAARRLGQPTVVGEMATGIVLGAAWPQLGQSDAMPWLDAAAQVGAVLYMFGVGVALDVRALNGRRAAITVASANVAVPLAAGACLALFAYPRLAGAHASLPVFALFVGVALSVTAFPVLARILSERGMTDTPLATLALACAAAGDVVAWCLLAVVVGVNAGAPWVAVRIVGLTAAYCGVMWWVVKPRLSRVSTPVLLLGAAVSAGVTHLIGVHAVFGAFLFGALVPSQRQGQIRRIQPIAAWLMPAFFASAGLRTKLGLAFDDAFLWAFIAVAISAKWLGAALAARWTGADWRFAARLGVLMNTRGMMELVVLDVGLSQGLISPALFAMGVVMTLVTTVMTGPLLWLRPLAPAPSLPLRAP